MTPAEQASEALLRSYLSTSQLAEWDQKKRFRVQGKAGRVWEIKLPSLTHKGKNFTKNNTVILVKQGRSSHIKIVQGRRYNTSLLRQKVPRQDDVLAKKLMLEANELEFIRRACVS